MELTYCINAFFFLKLVLSTGRAIMKTLTYCETASNGNLLLVDELLISRDRELSGCAVTLRT